MGLDSAGFVIAAHRRSWSRLFLCRFLLLDINGQTVFLLQLTTNLVALIVISVWLMSGELPRMNHIICNVHMNICGIFMHTAMALMLFKPKRLSKRALNIFKDLLGQFGFIIRTKGNNHVICFLSGCTCVQILHGLHLTYGQIKLFTRTTLMPAKQQLLLVVRSADIEG